MILADGCFDPLHMGHVRYLQAAKDPEYRWLFVRVARDEEIRAKGREPFQTLAERLALVEQLGPYVAVTTSTLADAIMRFRPHELVKGDDWEGRLPAEVLAACEQCGTAIRFTPTSGRTSTERLSA